MDNTQATDSAAHETSAASIISEVTELLATAAQHTSDMALLAVSGQQPPSLAQVNQNSFCHAIQSSRRHAHLCEPFCGQAFYLALENGDAASYRCHAGFNCRVVRIATHHGRQTSVIVGRTLTESDAYRKLEQRTLNGDLRDLASAGLFDRIHFLSKRDYEKNIERVIETLKGHGSSNITSGQEGSIAMESVPPSNIGNLSDGTPSNGAKASALISTTETSVAQLLLPIGMTLKEACNLVTDALAGTHNIKALLLALRFDDVLVSVAVRGDDASKTFAIDLEDSRLLQAAQKNEWLKIGYVKDDAQRFSIRFVSADEKSVDVKNAENAAQLFPLVVGNEVRGGLVIGDVLDDTQQRTLATFCHEIAVPLEVLRLREEVGRRTHLELHLSRLTEHLNRVEPDDAYFAVLQHSAELVGAERSSLFLFDEASNELTGRAALGPRAELARNARIRLGDGVSGTVLREGRALVVRDVRVETTGHAPAPAEHSYKTDSFISMPIIVGSRRVGVLNVTDKFGGGYYSDLDLDMLQSLAPQIALAIDRAEWHHKASQFRKLSITDSLTNLLNRRYLEERLSEEVERSKRHDFSMCFMMIDIDDFKLYNDRNGHQAGDLALELTAQNLKSALRAVDTAARYGGEEFSVLLPQTTIEEAQIIAERIRRRVERTRYPNSDLQPLGAITVSIGISAFAPGVETLKAIISHADQALYIAKHLGKNRIHVASSAVGSKQ
ncbi:MAG: sensor domain-containing diguanylate cyclase [Pyrinomonadaceae bacterium MAG19_C2-C3]|nr:sensor domain-containing diguanylate cyclase [Pyrinomonadaceae bacterium MAG19_C2-C3]